MNKKFFTIAGLAVGLAMQVSPMAMAQTFSSGTIDQLIPDGDLSGFASQIDISVPYSDLTQLTLTLDIAGDPTAYNGDYYAYLQFGSGLDVLLDHIDTPPTYGSSGNGINVTFADGNPNIGTAAYSAGSLLTGTYAPQSDGASTGSGLLGTFGGVDPNGQWTLFIADTAKGGQGELVDWSITMAGVPDNGSTMTYLGLSLAAMAAYSWRQRRAVKQLSH
jgi:hypothetical protein